MKVLVTGSAGHLGEALVRTLKNTSHEILGTDLLHSEFTDKTGTISDRAHVKLCMKGVDAVIHTATLHKPHIATHSRQEFIDTNITGTLNLLEEAAAAGVKSFVFTSSTSVFGNALLPASGAPAVWVTEDIVPVPKNIYGITKIAAENLCELFYRKNKLPCIVLRTSRFFPEEDDSKKIRQAFNDQNAKANEFLNRRIEIEDVVSAHLQAMEKAAGIGFGKYIISAATPFKQGDLIELRTHAPSVVKRLFPDYEEEYNRRGWKMFPGIDRVYINNKARNELGWAPQYNFKRILASLIAGEDPRSPLCRVIGSKGYHAEKFSQGPYPVE